MARAVALVLPRKDLVGLLRKRGESTVTDGGIKNLMANYRVGKASGASAGAVMRLCAGASRLESLSEAAASSASSAPSFASSASSSSSAAASASSSAHPARDSLSNLLAGNQSLHECVALAERVVQTARQEGALPADAGYRNEA